MTQLAKEFAISDVALHKVCKKHGIPNPPLGWWEKKRSWKEGEADATAGSQTRRAGHLPLVPFGH
jgi:hypothetical protein